MYYGQAAALALLARTRQLPEIWRPGITVSQNVESSEANKKCFLMYEIPKQTEPF